MIDQLHPYSETKKTGLPWLGDVPAHWDKRLFDIVVTDPPYDELIEDVRGIEERSRELRGAISRIEREIALIQEFHTRLIADVVTGKLDVRVIAAGLPEIGEAAPFEDLAEDDDLDEAVEETEDSEVAA